MAKKRKAKPKEETITLDVVFSRQGQSSFAEMVSVYPSRLHHLLIEWMQRGYIVTISQVK